MKVIAFNGSPRRKKNTGVLLDQALEGARSRGADTELVHLNSLDYKGCVSCFACKRIGGKHYGTCALNDDLTPYLEKARTADAILLGSPIYFADVTGAMRSLLERLMFPYAVYEKGYPTLFPRKIATAFIYTMNVTEEAVPVLGYEAVFNHNAQFLERIFGRSEYMLSTDTLQFDDYSKYVSTVWDKDKKAQRHAEHFPEDCRRAYELGEQVIRAATV